MLQTIMEAAENFCKEQLGSNEIEVSKETDFKSGALVAYIDIETKRDEKYRAYLAAERGFVQFVAKIFLEEEESDEETIMDMAMECTNLIVGSAKVIASEKGLDFTISTPHLEQVDAFEHTFDEAGLLECNGRALFIALAKI